MLNSKQHPLCSCKNPLWVAAFFFKQLKKAQIVDTDISSSVDKIMHYEMDAVSYRVLAYLLLGVVKVYSKKVEYLLHDCDGVLSGVNKFVINTKNKAPVEAMCMAFTMPETFDLDAFDLGELEDTSGYHTAPPEQITLKEVLSNAGGFAQFSQERFEDFDMQFEGFGFGETSCSLEQIMAENSILQFQPMDFDFEAFPSNSLSNLIEGSSEKLLEEFQKKVSFKEGTSSANPSEPTFIDETPQSKFHGDSSANPSEPIIIDETPQSKFHGDSSANPSEPTFIDETPQSEFHSDSSANPLAPITIDETPQSKFHGDSSANPSEPTFIDETPQSEFHSDSSANLSAPITIDETPQSKFHGDSIARPNSLNDLIQGSSEKLLEEFQKKVSFEEGTSSANPSEPTIIDETLRSKFNGGSIARPKPGASKSDFMLIPTPDSMESPYFSKKRKFRIDETTTLSSQILRKRIEDASNLVSVRKPLGVSLIDKQRKIQMFSLLNGFNESLFPCHSPKLKCLLSSNSKLKILDSIQIVSDVQESEAIGIPEHIQIAPEIPPTCSDSIDDDEIMGEFDAVESEAVESQATAPETPPLCSVANVRLAKHPERAISANSDNMVDEEMNSCETENSKMSGWSELTSKVATDLCKQKEAGSINLSKLSEGKTRKESARLFYEILVLKTTNYVDVQQKDAYGDIEVKKLPKFDKAFGV